MTFDKGDFVYVEYFSNGEYLKDVMRVGDYKIVTYDYFDNDDDQDIVYSLYVPFDRSRYLEEWYEDEIEPWYPTKGDWCWFGSVHGNYELGKFNYAYQDKEGNIKYNYILNGSNSDYNTSYCEPFCDTLPSKLEDERVNSERS